MYVCIPHISAYTSRGGGGGIGGPFQTGLSAESARIAIAARLAQLRIEGAEAVRVAQTVRGYRALLGDKKCMYVYVCMKVYVCMNKYM